MKETRKRMFVVVADAGPGTPMRVKDVKAYNHQHAAETYLITFPSKRVRAVGLLGGSGHPLHWIEGDATMGPWDHTTTGPWDHTTTGQWDSGTHSSTGIIYDHGTT